jgi:hypothetical protein
MALDDRLKTIRRVTGAAAATPYVRRLVTDDELRTDMSDFVRSANDLVREVAADAQVRRDVADIIRSLQEGASRVRQDIRPQPHPWRRFAAGAGLFFAGIGVAATLAYPRSRRGLVRVAGETRQRASTTVHDARERFGRTATDTERKAA